MISTHQSFSIKQDVTCESLKQKFWLPTHGNKDKENDLRTNSPTTQFSVTRRVQSLRELFNYKIATIDVKSSYIQYLESSQQTSTFITQKDCPHLESLSEKCSVQRTDMLIAERFARSSLKVVCANMTSLKYKAFYNSSWTSSKQHYIANNIQIWE